MPGSGHSPVTSYRATCGRGSGRFATEATKNVRPSNTEPLIRLNLEAKTREKMEDKVEELLGEIRS